MLREIVEKVKVKGKATEVGMYTPKGASLPNVATKELQKLDFVYSIEIAHGPYPAYTSDNIIFGVTRPLKTVDTNILYNIRKKAKYGTLMDAGLDRSDKNNVRQLYRFT